MVGHEIDPRHQRDLPRVAVLRLQLGDGVHQLFVEQPLQGGRPPKDHPLLLTVVIAFADPAVVGEVDGLTWIPTDRAWIR
jgi:hypothetical protein